MSYPSGCTGWNSPRPPQFRFTGNIRPCLEIGCLQIELVNMRSRWISMGPNVVTRVLTRWGTLDPEDTHGKDHAKTETEIGEMCLQARNTSDCWPLQKVGERHGTDYPESLRRNQPTLISGISPLELRDNEVLVFEALRWQCFVRTAIGSQYNGEPAFEIRSPNSEPRVSPLYTATHSCLVSWISLRGPSLGHSECSYSPTSVFKAGSPREVPLPVFCSLGLLIHGLYCGSCPWSPPPPLLPTMCFNYKFFKCKFYFGEYNVMP